jgi:hypothetical protein
MANRSDFFNAKLPRAIKRMLSMQQAYGWAGNEHDRGATKRMFIEAHANHVNFKLKRNTAENRDGADSE